MKVLDLFSGIGGFSLGLERAGFETVAFCEIEPYPQKVLKNHWPDIPIYEDVRHVTRERLEADGIFPDVITGGFPCQDISIAGKGAGLNGKRSGLWFEFKRIIHDLQPRYAIVENVPALLDRGLSTILGNLAEIGYDAAWTVFDSQYFGLPQRRRRVYILGIRDGIAKGADIFDLEGRSSAGCKQAVANIKASRAWDFTQGSGERDNFAFFTRQRSDEFACTGLSGTIAKRDYKSFTDLILQDGRLRRVTPKERLALQGYPSHWFSNLDIPTNEKFRMNGMTIPVVEYIGGRLRGYDES